MIISKNKRVVWVYKRGVVVVEELVRFLALLTKYSCRYLVILLFIANGQKHGNIASTFLFQTKLTHDNFI